eukprot:792706-Pleurochrysis_carterae.AAC.3
MVNFNMVRDAAQKQAIMKALAPDRDVCRTSKLSETHGNQPTHANAKLSCSRLAKLQLDLGLKHE